MRNIKLILEYDGTDFFGFQRQPGKRTIQSELEKAFQRIFRKRIKISAASGRTDAGVHAKGQVVNFKVDSEIPLRNIHRALNTYLPEDLAVNHIEEVSPDFHARFWAKSKIYQYAICNSPVRPVLERREVYHFPYPLNVAAIRRASRHILGRHDFRSFQTKADGRNSTRTIQSLLIQKKDCNIYLTIEGDGFLYNMVRNLVGALLLVGSGKLTDHDLKVILMKKSRSHVGPTTPALGLTLLEVKYVSK